jgi:integrase
MRRKVCYQNGSVFPDERTKKWYFRWREKVDGKTKRRAELIGTFRQFPTKTSALRAAEPMRARLNKDVEPSNPTRITVAQVVEKYIADEIPERYSTRKAYLCNLQNHIVPKWGDREIASIKPNEAEVWLKSIKYSPKTKTHLRNLLRLLVNSAMRRGYIELGRNPIELVRVAQATSRKQRTIITMAEFALVLTIMHLTHNA